MVGSALALRMTVMKRYLEHAQNCMILKFVCMFRFRFDILSQVCKYNSRSMCISEIAPELQK